MSALNPGATEGMVGPSEIADGETEGNDPGGRPRHRRRLLRAWPQYLAISPFYVIFTIFGLIPIIFTMALAFTDWDGLGPITWVGTRNFGYLVHDPLFYKSLLNSLILWVMGTTPTLILATVTALLLNKITRFANVYKVIFLLPNITSLVAMGILFTAIFSGQSGIANWIIGLFGFNRVDWLNNVWGIKIAIATLSSWSFIGYNALIVLAGLQSLPKSVHEAAALDGANGWQTFWRVTLPMLRPIVIFITLMSTIGSLQGFTEAQVLTSRNAGSAAAAGGLDNSGLTMVLYFFSVAFLENRYGYGATISWGVFVVVTFFSIINWLVTRGSKEES